jgi:hypothetical protein
MQKPKKTYTPPTVTEHGDVVKQTTGMGGKYLEFMSPKYYGDLEDPPFDPPIR